MRAVDVVAERYGIDPRALADAARDLEMLSRFLPKVDIRGADECWNWQGAKKARGYGSFAIGNSRSEGAHRVAFRLMVGPIPSGFEVDHLCRNTSCVNPRHLEAVPKAVNGRRSNSPWGLNARKTHCLRGHAFDDENTVRYTRRGTERGCRECRKLAKRRAYAARKALREQGDAA